jgi:hypothetical protein
VLIDPPAWPAHGRLWSHLASDSSFDELHAFAVRAGVPPRGFEGDHYDVPDERYDALVAAGAQPVTSRDLLRALQRSGLRRPKRKGERVLASTTTPDGTTRWDLIASTLQAPVPASEVVLVTRASRDGGQLLVVSHEGACHLPHRALAARSGVDVGATRPCGHERTAPLGRYGPDLARASWLTVLRADVPASTPAVADGGARWVDADDVRATRPRWWPLVEWVTRRP